MKNRDIILATILSLLLCGGLPCTALAGPRSVPVTVDNTRTNPVPITGTVAVAENPARDAVQQEIIVPLASDGNGSASIQIPAGKIFVLEFVAFFTPSTTLFEVGIDVTGNLITGGQDDLEYGLVIPRPIALGTQGSQALRLYARPGLLTVFCGTKDTGGFVRVDLSGYLVNAQ